MTITLQNTSPAALHHLHITSANPDALATFYQKHFTLAACRSGALHVLRGGARCIIIGEGAPASLAYAGYTLESDEHLINLRERLLKRGVQVESKPIALFRSGAFMVSDPQGRKTAFGVALEPRVGDAMPGRLQHTVFQTTELENVVRFYVDKIGFTISDEVVDEDGKLTVVFLRSDDEHHSLAFFRGKQNDWDHHCYETNEWNDIRDWGDQFAKQHVPIFFGPGRHGPGNNLFFMVTDPDGNRLEFSAELQQVPTEKNPGIWEHSEYTLNSWGRAWIRT